MLGFERVIWIPRPGVGKKVSVDGVNIPLFLNSLDIFRRKLVSFVELVIVLRINAAPLETPPLGPRAFITVGHYFTVGG